MVNYYSAKISPRGVLSVPTAGRVPTHEGAFMLVAHLLATSAKLLRPGGVRSVVAESLLLKHQLLTLKRSRKKAPKLTVLRIYSIREW